ncbi:hypothetical protein [Solibacillus cecembensis]|uniref:hypothetical protein n=1 Tax=Solibacillus cecembensis TaxID=459347 RepID=UPI000716EB4F
MTENNQSEAPKKKLSLQELVKQQLENKKNQSASAKGSSKGDTSTKKMKSQQTKKTSNTRRKMGV